MRTLLPILFLLLAPGFTGMAQWHSGDPARLFERFHHRMQQNPSDSAAFARFGADMARTTPDNLAPNELSAYRLVWDVTCEGGTWLSRGKGTDLETFLKDPPEKRFGEIVCCPRFLGGRYAVIHWEPPTGLVRYRYWFFERK